MNINPLLRVLYTLTLLFVLAVLSGCNLLSAAQTPIVVYVTPTGGATSSISATDSSTYGAIIGADTTLATALPTFTQGVLNTPLPQPSPTGPTPAFGSVIDPQAVMTSQPVNTAQQTLSTAQPAGTLTTQSKPTYGAVIDPDYTPPPSVTPVVPTPVTPDNVTLPPAVTAGPSPTPGPILKRDLMGVQVHGFLTKEEWDSMVNHVHKLGLGWVKVQVQWEDMEPEKGKYSFQYDTLVLAIQRASTSKIRTMISIAKAPDWARPANVRGKEDGPAANPQDFGDFVRQLVIDIKPEFLDAVEVWNEPNLIREWQGAPITGAEYMKHFDAAYKAVIEAQQMLPSALRPNHRITVLTAGVAPTGTDPGQTLNDREWLQQLYSSGLANYGEDVAIGAHPYGWANPPEALCCTPSPGVTGWYEHPVFYFRNTLDSYYEIVQENNDPSRKIWITEFGYASYDGLLKSDGTPASVNPASGWQGLIDRNQQAEYILRAFQIAQKPPYFDFLGPLMLWNLNFATIPQLTDLGREEAGFSLLDQNYQPRPVYIKLQDAPKE